MFYNGNGLINIKKTIAAWHHSLKFIGLKAMDPKMNKSNIYEIFVFFGPKRRPVSGRTYNVIKAGLSFNNFNLFHVKNYLVPKALP